MSIDASTQKNKSPMSLVLLPIKGQLIVALENGRVKEQGTHEELMLNPKGIYSHFIQQREQAKGWRIV